MKNNIIYAENVNKRIKGVQIINNVSISVEEQAIVAIMGLSGAGKSTMLNLLSGLEPANSGKIVINGTNLMKLKEPKLTRFRSNNISYVFQDYKLIDYLTVLENITITEMINKNKVDKSRLADILARLKLNALLNLNVNKLSGGQKQRVAIARALLGQNKIIFADEPTGALDIFTRNETIKALADNAKAYCKTLVVVTHDPYVASFAEKIIFMKKGLIASIGQNLAIKDIIAQLQKMVPND